MEGSGYEVDSLGLWEGDGDVEGGGMNERSSGGRDVE